MTLLSGATVADLSGDQRKLAANSASDGGADKRIAVREGRLERGPHLMATNASMRPLIFVGEVTF